MQKLVPLLSEWSLSIFNTSTFTPLYRLLLFLTEKDIKWQSLTELFMTRVRPLDKEFHFTKSELVSGAAFFYISLAISIWETASIDKIDQLFSLTACYMILDNFLDHPIYEDEEKDLVMSELEIILQTLANTNENTTTKINNTDQYHPITKAVNRYLQHIVKTVPEAIKSCIELFVAEKTTAKFQKQSGWSSYPLIVFAEYKGGATCDAITSIIGVENSFPYYRLGSIIQLLDDLIDVEEDQELEINTPVTQCLNKHGNIDEIVDWIADSIRTLPNVLEPFKFLLCFALIVILSIHFDYLSTLSQGHVKKYLMVNNNHKNREDWIDWFYDFLTDN